jgi:eukaryotic-like serine/threonine-protein kinase
VSRDVQAGQTGVSSISRGEQFPIGLLVRSRYRLVSELGAGAYGTVCLADDESTGHRVAIRFLPRKLAETPDAAQAVLRMARSIVAASSAHPGLTRVLEFGEVDNGRPFAIMELVEGRRLSEIMSTGKPLDVAAAMRVALDLGGAVETLHNLGFIHGALGPHNIMVLEDGRIKLLDLELVGLRDAREIQGVIATEPQAEYLSPEQILKAPVTEKADIYAFGAILYELLCGAPPFEAATREAVLDKQLKETPVPIHRRRNDVPGSVERAVMLALQKQPDSRPLMGDVLNLLWTGAHSPAPRRRRAALIVGGVALAAVAAGAVTWGVLALRPWAPAALVPPTAAPGQAPVSARPPSPAPVTGPRRAPTVAPASPARPPTAVERAPVAAPPRSPAAVTETRPAPTVAPAPPPVAPPAAARATPPPTLAPPRAERREPPRPPRGPAGAAPERPAPAPAADDPGAVIDWLINSSSRP